MEYNDNLREEIRKKKRDTFEKIIHGIDLAIKDNKDVYYITDLMILGDLMTYKVHKPEFELVLEKARLYFEETEDFEYCKMCRDLKKQIQL